MNTELITAARFNDSNKIMCNVVNAQRLKEHSFTGNIQTLLQTAAVKFFMLPHCQTLEEDAGRERPLLGC